MQILFIEKDESQRVLFKANAIKSLGVEVIERASTDEAVSLIQLLPTLDLIICKEDLEGSQDVVSCLHDDGLSIPLLWLGEATPKYKNSNLISKNVPYDKLLIEIKKILKLEEVLTQDLSGGYQPVDCRYFLYINSTSLGCDVFIKIKKEGKDHFIKCFHSTDHFNRAQVEKYTQSGLKEFYVPSTHYVQFINFVTDKLVLKLDDSRLNSEEKVSLNAEAYRISVERIQSLRVDDFTVEVVQASVNAMMAAVSENNALGNFLKSMSSDNLSYSYANAHLMSLVLHKIVDHFEWSSDQIKSRLTYAAYFHNISLKDEGHMKVRSMEALIKLNLTGTEADAILKHAYQSSVLIDSFKEIPDGVKLVIKEHHGMKNGVGFAETPNISLTPLSMMFVVVEDFVDEFLSFPGKPLRVDYEAMLSRLEKRYTKLAFAETVKALSKMVLGK
ncbi:MAG: hypothetical protein HOP07_02080 [Bacteriovoracaceae bacterium]|nr:hypothetical protein [Bacteriovoracaceae bacterium]